MSKDNPWLNAAEAAEYLRLTSVAALYQAVRRGQIPGYKLGRRYRFRREELDEVIQRHPLLTLDEHGISSL